MFNERKHLHSPENRLKNVKRRKHLHSQVKLLNFPAHEPAAWWCVLWWRWQSLRCRRTCGLHWHCGVHCHHLWSTLASALHVLLKNQLSQPLARLLPRQEGFHLFLVNISIPCEKYHSCKIFTLKRYSLAYQGRCLLIWWERRQLDFHYFHIHPGDDC